jgi:hypothetical protein
VLGLTAAGSDGSSTAGALTAEGSGPDEAPAAANGEAAAEVPLAAEVEAVGSGEATTANGAA